MSRRLEIRLLGRFEVLVDGLPVEIDSQPVQFLLAYLALHPNLEHRRDKLAGVLWLDSDESNARANLRHALWRLRQAIGDGFLDAETATIRLNSNAGAWIDAATLDRDAAPGTSLDDRLAALSAYRGELLPGIYAEWVGLERERLASVFQRRMQSALEELLQAARWTDAVQWAEHWISLGQVPEPAYRALMTAHAAGNDSGAMALAYQRCVDALRTDLGVEPSQETQQLYRNLASGERPQSAATPPEAGSSGNLPAQTNTFIGRELEIEAIQEMLARPDIRLLTLTGPGGTGKTRLATRVAARMQDSFRDGAWFVDLAPLADAGRVASAIAAVLGVRERGDTPVKEALTALLRQRRLLLLLDNFEHLIEAAPLVHDLLAAAPDVKFLVTSRESLQIYGESEFPVPPLPLPAREERPTAASVGASDSARLFTERARAARPDLQLTDDNAEAVAEICRHLDGLPLALELAAARVKLFPPEVLVERLGSRLGTLTGGPRDAPARQRTLRGTIEWSYALLDDSDRVLFSRFSVFAGGSTLAAAEAVCAGEGQPDFLVTLQSLVNKSLLRQEAGVEREPRFRMLETLREFAAERLEESAEAADTRRRHATYFAGWATEAAGWLEGQQTLPWLLRLESEHDNLRAALKWSLDSDRDADLALELVGALASFWILRGYLTEGYGSSQAVLASIQPGASIRLLAKATLGAARIAYRRNSIQTAEKMYAEALRLAREIGDEAFTAASLIGTGMVETERGEYAYAPAKFTEALELYRGRNHITGQANALLNLGWTAMRTGDYGAQAEGWLQESLDLNRRASDRADEAFSLSGLGEFYLRTGDLDRAAKYLGDSLEIRSQIGDKWGMAATLGSIGWAALVRGEAEAAVQHFKESLRLRNEQGDKGGMAWCLEKIAEVAAVDLPDRAASLYGGAAALRASVGSSIDAADRPGYEQRLRELKDRMGEGRFGESWAKGEEMGLGELVAFGMGKGK